MPPRATRAAQGRAPQSQVYQLQLRTQRGKRRVVEEEDEEDEEEIVQMDSDEDVDMDGSTSGSNDIKRMAYGLVRLALFNEQRRMPLRRDDISKKVLGSNSRQFNTVFAEAQEILRDTFGMELAELLSRAELDNQLKGGSKSAPGADKDLDEARKATNMKKRAVAAGSKTYILRSTLSPAIISYATLTEEHILQKEMEEEADDESDDDYANGRSYGSILNWNKSDQLGGVGILYVILALILANGRAINNMELRAQLKKLRLVPTSTITLTKLATHQALPLDSFLTQLMRQGYIDKVSINDANKKTGGSKRGRTAATQGEDDNAGAYEWRWGIRAHSEVGEEAIAEFVGEFMIDRSKELDEDGTVDQEMREENNTKVKRICGSIERSAGGVLQGLR